jgi:outer membrane protein assembly factor BamA
MRSAAIRRDGSGAASSIRQVDSTAGGALIRNPPGWIGAPLLILALLLAGCGAQARLEGNRRVSDAALEAAARRPLASWREHQRHADLVDAAAAMRERLDRLGYMWAEVDPAGPAADDPDRLPRFTVREGPRVAVSGVLITGDTGLPKERLVELAGFGRWLTTASVKDAPGRLLRGLRQAGHLRAEVHPALVEWSEARDAALLHLQVAAGPRFIVSAEELVVEGDQDLRSGLVPLLDPPGTVCHPRLVSEVAARLRGHLADYGYRQATVTPTTQVDEERATMSVRLVVVPGTRQTVASLTVIGGRRTIPAFVERHLREVAPGRPLSQSALDAGVSSLTLTGLYRRVQVETDVGEPAADGSAPTQVTVLLVENPTRRVDLSVGYGSYEQLRGGVEYVDEHLLGRGLRFNLGSNASLKGWGAETGLQDPYLLGPGRSIGVELRYSDREEPSFFHQEVAATLMVTQKMKPTFDPVPYELRTTYAFTQENDYRLDAALAGEEEEDDYTTSAVGFAVRRDSRMPKIIDPDRGTYVQLGTVVSAKPLGAEVEFVEFSAEFSAAIDPAPWLVVAFRAAATTRDPFDDDESLPIGERLFLGGEDSVRSFTRDDLGPRDADGSPLGGLSRGVVNLELRWRLLPRHRALEIATFYDIGMVSEDTWNISGPPGQAIGAGLRYRTPVGPIRLDYGYNPGDRLGADHPWALHVAVGFAF